MAIKVGGTTVINDSRQLSNITSVDATTVAALGVAGVGGGGGIELTTSEAVVEGDRLAFDFTTGKVKKVRRIGGKGDNTGEGVYDSSQSNASLQIYDLIAIPSLNKIAVLGNAAGNTTVMVGQISSTGALTWGTSWYGDSGGQQSGSKLVYDESASRLVAIYKKSNGHTLGRVLSISGNNVTNEGGTTLTTTAHAMSANTTQVAAVYSPTHQRIIVAWCDDSATYKYTIQVGNVGSSSISWSSTQGPNSNYFTNGGQYIRNVAIAVNGSTIVFCGREASSGTNFIRAATMSGSTLSFGSGHSFNIGNEQDMRTYAFHVSHTSQHANRFAYGGRDSGGDSTLYHFEVSGTSISNGQNYTLNGNSGGSNGYTFAYDPANKRTYVFNNYIRAWVGSDDNDMRQSNTHAEEILHNTAYTNIRAASFEPSSGFVALIGAQNPTKVYRYALQDDNFNYFVGCAKEAASANSTVKIANSGQIATGLSGLTPGQAYRIRYDGAWANVQNAISNPATFADENTRARMNGVALTATTMLMVNDFMSYD